jgi:hypothetical protein
MQESDFINKLNKTHNDNVVYVIQAVPGTKEGRPKINIVGAQEFGRIEILLDEDKQIMFSPGPIIRKLKRLLRNYTEKDYVLLTGDPAIIGVVCSIVSDMLNGKFKLLKWDRQERQYYPIEIDIHQKGGDDE